MAILPDYLEVGLSIVFCGTAAAARSAKRGHYYSGPGNDFWRLLYESTMTAVRLAPEDDYSICQFGCGLTDLAKEVTANSDTGLRPHYRVEEFLSKIDRFAPKLVAFHGKEAAKVVARHLGHRGRVRLGLQPWRLAQSTVFVLPSASGANRDKRRLEGKVSRLGWFSELANIIRGNSRRS